MNEILFYVGLVEDNLARSSTKLRLVGGVNRKQNGI